MQEDRAPGLPVLHAPALQGPGFPQEAGQALRTPRRSGPDDLVLEHRLAEPLRDGFHAFDVHGFRAPSRPNVRHYYITCGNVRQEAAREKLWDKIVPDAYCICRDRVLYLQRSAGVMELVDVVDSKSTAGDSVPVRVRSPAPNPYNPNLFLIGDGFGLLVFFERFESTHFRNEVERKATSKPRGPRKKTL